MIIFSCFSNTETLPFGEGASYVWFNVGLAKSVVFLHSKHGKSFVKTWNIRLKTCLKLLLPTKQLNDNYFLLLFIGFYQNECWQNSSFGWVRWSRTRWLIKKMTSKTLPRQNLYSLILIKIPKKKNLCFVCRVLF